MRKENGPVLISALWGLGEATLFFIVPDVYLTLLAVRDRRASLRGCVAATAGALAGGALMFFWGSTDPAGAASALLSVPAISREMLEKVHEGLASTGALALFLGPVTGTPYKIYAVESGALGLSPLVFLLVSVPARDLRFVVLALATDRVSRGLVAFWPLPLKRLAVAALWTAFYVFYFAVKSKG
jgi:membrane protein YqaA with SNARE-associated domain